MTFDQTAFNNFIIDQGIVGFFPKPIQLSSGRMSSWYVNWRNVAGDVFTLDQLSDFLLSFVGDQKIGLDCFYGTPDGATKLAVITQYKWAKTQTNFAAGSHALPMGRKKPKEHGQPQDRFFVGAPRGRVVVLEDVTTTGGSLLDTVKTLKELEVNVVATIALTNRNELMDDRQHVSEALGKIGVPYLAMSQGLELLPLAAAKHKPSAQVIALLRAEYEQFGQKPLIF